MREDLPRDDIFMSKYSAFLKGKATVHNTRTTLTSIRRGFWRPIGKEFELLDDTPPTKSIEHMKEMIRLGSRPTLHLYENPNKGDIARYVCTDDTATHAAYEALGISVVPTVLMGKPSGVEESCISVRSYRRGPNNWIALIEGVTPVTHKLVPSLVGKSPLPLHDSLSYLVNEIQTTKDQLRQFHTPGAIQFHYHHTLYSVLLRTEETISSILQLVESGQILVATSLLRPLYELTLTFYVDWLSPGHIYRYLQLASVMPEKNWLAHCDEEMRKLISSGLSAFDAKNIRDAHMRSYRLCSVVSEKARIFPFGEEFHRDIYSFLSDILHHDYSMNARYTHTLDHGDDAIYSSDAAASINHLTNILVSAIVTRIRNDIGIYHLPVTTNPSVNNQAKDTAGTHQLS